MMKAFRAIALALSLLAASTPVWAQQQSGGGAPSTVSIGPSNNDAGSSVQATLGSVAPVSGNYYTAFNIQFTTGSAATAGRIVCVPLVIVTTITVKWLGVRITTVGTSNVQFALYTNSGGYPASLIEATGNVSNTVANIFGGSITPATLSPGLYWGCTNSNDSTMIMQGPGSTTGSLGWTVGSAAANQVTTGANSTFLAWYYSGTFGTWPALSSTGATSDNVQQGAAFLLQSQ